MWPYCNTLKLYDRHVIYHFQAELQLWNVMKCHGRMIGSKLFDMSVDTDTDCGTGSLTEE